MRLFFVLALLLFNSACANSTHTNQQAKDVYNAFLNGDTYYIEDEYRVTIPPGHDSEFSLIDMNNDGTPELVTTVVIHQYRTEEDLLVSSMSQSAIFTIQEGQIVPWYFGGSHSFEVLSNKALLAEYEELGGYSCYYIELADDGKMSTIIHAFKEPVYSDGQITNAWNYYLDGVEITEEIWENWFDMSSPE